MGLFDKTLLVSDFDGTLTGSDGNIPFSNVEKIKYFISQGGKFTVSTGRTKIGFHNFSSDIINAPVLLGNGAMAFDYFENMPVFINGINEDGKTILEKILCKFPFVGMEIYSVNDDVFVINPNEKNINHFSSLKIKDYSIVKSLDEINFPAVKIMLSVGNKTFEVQDYLRCTDLGNIKYIPCTGDFVEILSQTAGKGKALFQLADYLGIDSNRVFAVGDGSNDVDMLKAATIGFAPESCDVLAKKAADKIVCISDKGCVAAVIDLLAALN